MLSPLKSLANLVARLPQAAKQLLNRNAPESTKASAAVAQPNLASHAASHKKQLQEAPPPAAEEPLRADARMRSLLFSQAQLEFTDSNGRFSKEFVDASLIFDEFAAVDVILASTSWEMYVTVMALAACYKMGIDRLFAKPDQVVNAISVGRYVIYGQTDKIDVPRRVLDIDRVRHIAADRVAPSLLSIETKPLFKSGLTENGLAKKLADTSNYILQHGVKEAESYAENQISQLVANVAAPGQEVALTELLTTSLHKKLMVEAINHYSRCLSQYRLLTSKASTTDDATAFAEWRLDNNFEQYARNTLGRYIGKTGNEEVLNAVFEGAVRITNAIISGAERRRVAEVNFGSHCFQSEDGYNWHTIDGGAKFIGIVCRSQNGATHFRTPGWSVVGYFDGDACFYDAHCKGKPFALDMITRASGQ